MGNESSALKNESVQRRNGALLGVDHGTHHAKKEKAMLAQLQKARMDKQAEVDTKEGKMQRREKQEHWDNLKEAVSTQFVERILTPFENMTGISQCVNKHCEDDEEEEVVHYIKQKKGGKSAKDRVKEMMREESNKEQQRQMEYLRDAD
mmetsp:Transcript_49573/g.123823  ORF Transcript_49573/g.123823 Transcript_49573/m.123823 type:complete len:149 (+) Transcript_49573:47-493(+)